MKDTGRLKSALTVIGFLVIVSVLPGCRRGSSDPVSPPITEQAVEDEIKKIQNNPTAPPQAKAQQIAKIKYELEKANRQKSSK